MKKAIIIGTILAVLGGCIMIYAVLFLGSKNPPMGTKDVSTSNEISIADLALHKTEQSCWIAFSGRVFDISPYLNSHSETAKTFTTCGQSTNDLPLPFKKVTELGTYQIGILVP